MQQQLGGLVKKPTVYGMLMEMLKRVFKRRIRKNQFLLDLTKDWTVLENTTIYF